jgi:hypothetical protein
VLGAIHEVTIDSLKHSLSLLVMYLCRIDKILENSNIYFANQNFKTFSWSVGNVFLQNRQNS